MTRAFLGHYPSVRLIQEFIRQAGFDLVLSPRTTPDILEAGTTLASADYCLPLRVFVGHIHHLWREHQPDYLVCPNVYRENDISSTCAKYRDTGGIAVRSLAGAIGYTLNRVPGHHRHRLGQAWETGAAEEAMESADGMPTVLDPCVWTMESGPLRNLCYRLYMDLLSRPRGERVLASWGVPQSSRAASDQAFDRALKVVESRRRERWDEFTTTDRVRLALVGRDYLVEDPILTADMKPFFQKAGAAVITARGVPWDMLREGYHKTRGFYDVHRLLQSFIDATLDVADGYVITSSFGCHPDAFMMEQFLDYIRDRGVPAWLLKYDEQTGSAGYRTRYETIYGFLEGRRDRTDAARHVVSTSTAAAPTVTVRDRRPAIVWPHFTHILDLVIEEVFHQVGLSDYMLPPLPATEATVARPDIRHAESCCPYAITTGSLLETLEDFLDRNGDESNGTISPEPHHILMLQAQGEGPCTFGWYSMAQAREIPRLLGDRMERDGHRVEMGTIGLDGARDLLEKLVPLGDSRRLTPLLELTGAAGNGTSWGRRQLLTLDMLRSLVPVLSTTWAKLKAVEDVRAKWLILKAHEIEPGSFSGAYRDGLDLLKNAHTFRDIARARKQALRILDEVPANDRPAPRVAVVGEIYVCLSGFANRGTVETLLGREGVEVVEAVTISDFILDSAREMMRRLVANQKPARALKNFLKNRDIPFLEQRVRNVDGRPFCFREVGGEGVKCVGMARHHIENGVDGIVHLYPFKCMPEGIARDALREMCDLYGVRYLPLTFHRETEMERLRTEISTFAALLHMEREAGSRVDEREMERRRQLGRVVSRAHDASRASRHLP